MKVQWYKLEARQALEQKLAPIGQGLVVANSYSPKGTIFTVQLTTGELRDFYTNQLVVIKSKININ